MPDTFSRQSTERIAKSVRHTESASREAPQEPRLLPTGQPRVAARLLAVTGIPDAAGTILHVHDIVEDDRDPWLGGHVWGAEETIGPASTWPGLQGSEYRRLHWQDSHPPGAAVLPSVHVLEAKQSKAGVWYVKQLLRFSIPERRADIQISDCTMPTLPGP